MLGNWIGFPYDLVSRLKRSKYNLIAQIVNKFDSQLEIHGEVCIKDWHSGQDYVVGMGLHQLQQL